MRLAEARRMRLTIVRCCFALAAILASCAQSVRIDDGDDDGSGTGSDTGSDNGSASAACKHVDVLIAVDNSGSMSEEKTALRDIAFPGFAQALVNVGGGIDDFRVGVTDGCATATVLHTAGASGPCNYSSGEVWIESTSPKLVDEFQCVGDIASGVCMTASGDAVEAPTSAAASVLQTALPASPKPNGGFLRDDALLVVVAITDEDEQPDPDASAQELYNRLIAIKGGDIKKIVFLGIGGATQCNGAYGSAQEATLLRDITNLFIANQRGVFWDLCQGNLEQGLTQALTTIDSACEDFGPIL
jgi:hypothetical protein